MKTTITILLILITGFISSYSQTVQIPKSTNKFINDFAGVIPDDKEQSLIDICSAIQNESSAQVVVVTSNDVPSDYPIENFSYDLATQWGIGQKGVDNGLLIVILPNNRQSRIEVGYGLEGILTDGTTKSMQTKFFNPNFRQGNFYTGIFQILNDIKNKISPEAIQQRKEFDKQQEKESKERWESFKDSVINILFGILFIILVVFLVNYFIKKQQEKKKKIKNIRIQKLEEEKRILEYEENIKRNAILQEKKLKQSFDFNKKTIHSMPNGWLNSQQIFSSIKEDFENTIKLLEKEKYVNYYSIINPVLEKWNNITNDLFWSFNIYKQTKELSDKLSTFNFEVSNVLTVYFLAKSYFEKYDIKKEWHDFDSAKVISKEGLEKVVSQLNEYHIMAENYIKQNDFKNAEKNILNFNQNVDYIKSIKDRFNLKNSEIQKALEFITGFKTIFYEYIKNNDETFNNHFIPSQLKDEWIRKKSGFLTINLFNENFSNPFDEVSRLKNILSTIQHLAEPALSLINQKKEEEAQKKAEEIRKKAEKERRQREGELKKQKTEKKDNPFSSSVDNNSNDSGFGGGSFGGGGSTNDW